MNKYNIVISKNENKQTIYNFLKKINKEKFYNLNKIIRKKKF